MKEFFESKFNMVEDGMFSINEILFFSIIVVLIAIFVIVLIQIIKKCVENYRKNHNTVFYHKEKKNKKLKFKPNKRKKYRRRY